MTLWLVRVGRHGEYEQEMLDENVIVIGWKNLPDLSKIKDRDELKALYIKHHPDETKYQIANHAGQVWSFINRIKIGDLIASPLKTQSSIEIGEVTGNYEYQENATIAKHRKKVKWKKLFPRSAFDQDILNALGAILTVGRVRNETAEQRVMKMLKNDYLPNFEPVLDDDEPIPGSDYEQSSKDDIIKFIERKFQGHDLERLIDGIFIAKGYTTEPSPRGADGGVDILASSGNLGFDDPKICIQVKSSQSPVNVKVLRELDGVLKNFGANYAILVAWGGFKITNKEMRTSFFTTKLWDQGKIIDELLANYDNLPSDLKLEIPLKKIWTLVKESTD